jgi:hypothetical protein
MDDDSTRLRGSPAARLPRAMTPESAARLAESAFLFIASDDERLSHFIAVSGFDSGNARDSAAQPGFLAGVLAHLMTDEPLLLAFAAEQHVHPLSVALSYRVIPGGDPALEINAAG